MKVYDDMRAVYQDNIAAIEKDLVRLNKLTATFPENFLFRLIQREIHNELTTSQRYVTILDFLKETTLQRNVYTPTLCNT